MTWTTIVISVLIGLLVGLGVGWLITSKLKRTTQETQSLTGSTRPQVGLTIFVGLLLVTLCALIVAAGLLINSLNTQTQATSNPPNPEIVMGILVVGAIAALMTVLFILAVGFSSLNLTNPNQALGLPEGSIRAMIALVLIMVFIIFGIHLFRRVSEGNTSYIGNMKTVPSAKEYGVRNILAEPKIVSSGARQDTTYEVWTITDINDDGKRLAQQLVTVVGTLVVSVSSFYFGSAIATSAAKKEREQFDAGKASLGGLKPDKPDDGETGTS
jgi:flagellar biogenesis protein FliO